MSRISSIFFIISLLSYYILKTWKKRRDTFLNIHIGSGIISGVIMGIVFIQSLLSKENILKYFGFTIIIVLIITTGFLRKNNYRYKKWHIITMIMFFIYLIFIIVF
ncbi:MAG: hypothetical protein ACRDAU_05340 [Clostridium sp.]